MNAVAIIAVLVVAALHGYFMLLEMVLWNKPFGRKTFGLTQEFAEASKGLAANQGLYNGFLVAGLLWSAIAGPTTPIGFAVGVFFLVCVIVAGLFGAATVNRKIFFVQALPGAIALILLWLAPHA
jgi:putative membrane protein